MPVERQFCVPMTPIAQLRGCTTEELKFRMGIQHICLANAIKRTIQSRLKSVAVDHIVVHKNRSNFWDEYIAHRIGMCPFITAGGSSGTLKLSVSNDTDEIKQVTSSDFETHTDFRFMPHIPLAYLTKGNRLDIDAVIGVGSGSDHARFAPCIAYYDLMEADKCLDVILEQSGYMHPIDALIRALNDLLEETAQTRHKVFTTLTQ